MEEVVSLVVANGLWAVLFCALLVYELRDSRGRERKYTGTIKALSERLDIVCAVKTDTAAIIARADDIVAEVKAIRADAQAVKRAVIGGEKKPRRAECTQVTAKQGV